MIYDAIQLQKHINIVSDYQQKGKRASKMSLIKWQF